MDGRLDGKVALITGAASGIGWVSAERFVRAGAKVVATDIADEQGKALQRSLGDDAIYVHADVTSEADMRAAVDAAVETFGGLDIMFNNAGAPGDPAPLTEVSVDGFDRTVELLVRSVMLGTKYAARQFIRQGTPGAIVNTASCAGLQAGWGTASYTVAKHAVIGVTRQAAMELGSHRIRANAIAPGVIRTPILARISGIDPEDAEEFSAFIEARHGAMQPIGRLGLPEDIAEAALWLASDSSSFVTGIVLPVDGGATAIHDGASMRDIGAAIEAFKRRVLTEDGVVTNDGSVREDGDSSDA